jgi:phosphate-selective porin
MVAGGMEQSFTIAMKWYLNNNIRVMWNYRHIIETDQGSIVSNQDTLNKEAAGLNIFTTRVQFNF